MFKKLKQEIKNIIEMSMDELAKNKTLNLDQTEITLSDNNQTRTFSKESFPVVGINYYTENLNKSRTANPEYRKRNLPMAKRIYRYTYVDRPVKLIFEPQNPNDRNAIKVLIAGEHVGYIGRNENLHVGDILKHHEIKYIYASFKGGEYKMLVEDNEIIKAETSLKIDLHLGYI